MKRRLSWRWLRIVIVAGPATFLPWVLGFAVAAGFWAYPASFAKALILFIEAFMVLSIAAIFPLLVSHPIGRSPIGDAADGGNPRRGLDGRGADRPRPVRACWSIPIPAQDSRLQPAGQRCVPGLRIIARKGAAGGFAADPVPQAITGDCRRFRRDRFGSRWILRPFEESGRPRPTGRSIDGREREDRGLTLALDDQRRRVPPGPSSSCPSSAWCCPSSRAVATLSASHPWP